MKVLWYLAVPVILVATYCVVMWFRSRKPTSLQSGVDSFHKEMQALAPEGVDQEPLHGAPPVGSTSRRAEPTQRRP